MWGSHEIGTRDFYFYPHHRRKITKFEALNGVVPVGIPITRKFLTSLNAVQSNYRNRVQGINGLSNTWASIREHHNTHISVTSSSKNKCQPLFPCVSSQNLFPFCIICPSVLDGPPLGPSPIYTSYILVN